MTNKIDKIVIRPYALSSSAKQLKDSLLAIGVSALRVKAKDSIYIFKSTDLVVNWGGTKPINHPPSLVLNPPEAVRKCVNKAVCFHSLKEIQTLPFTEDRSVAEQWIKDGAIVYCRTLIKSSKGNGIVCATKKEDLVDCKLYTKGVSCKREYRMHIFGGTCIDLVAKCKKNGLGGVENDLIRNCANGYIFARNSVTIPDSIRKELESLSVKAIKTLGLHFGAVDIIRDINNNLYVVEVNSAPGIEGTTVAAYVKQLKEVYDVSNS